VAYIINIGSVNPDPQVASIHVLWKRNWQVYYTQAA